MECAGLYVCVFLNTIQTFCLLILEKQADNGHEQDLANARRHWHKAGAPLRNQFPPMEYSRESDFFSAYILYYLQLCVPSDAKRPANGMSQPQYNLAKRVFVKCAWLVLQITCLICEYRLGAENNSDGKWNQNPKSLLGAIELYLSYFGWTLACYQDPRNMQQAMPFSLWHQCYVGDLQV